MRPDPTAVFYISSHGFGHAVRQIEVINACLARYPGLRVLVRSDAPAGLFTDALTCPCPVVPGETDTGVVQVDSLRVDPAASIARAWDFHRTLDERAEAEARWLRAQGATLVAADMPALAFAAAAVAGIPAVGIGNFTWDWIYAHYASFVDVPAGLVSGLERAYANAAGAWRVQMAAGFETFPTVRDAPLVARHAGRAPGETRARLGLADDRPAVLVSFGRYGLDAIDWAGVGRERDLQVVVTRDAVDIGPALPPGADNAALVRVDLPALVAEGFRYPDLVAAVDVVLTKPGYGIIAECAANATGVLYTSRGDFAEYAVLVDAMPGLVRCGYITQPDLFAGRWGPAVRRVLARPRVPTPRTDGAAVVAAALAEYLT